MSGTDHVSLFDDPACQVRSHHLPWDKAWPPWEHLTLVTGIHTGVKALVNTDGLRELAERALEGGISIEELYHQAAYVRVTYSDLPESVALDPESHLFRDARYVRQAS